MEIEFLELKQGERSVAEYEAKFIELARFVPDYAHSEAQKARRFQHGLKPEIWSGVVILQLKTYTSVVQEFMSVSNVVKSMMECANQTLNVSGVDREDAMRQSVKRKIQESPLIIVARTMIDCQRKQIVMFMEANIRMSTQGKNIKPKNSIWKKIKKIMPQKNYEEVWS
ncbi:hypothetical protein AgCh_005886 [Apium graveolens]